MNGNTCNTGTGKRRKVYQGQIKLHTQRFSFLQINVKISQDLKSRAFKCIEQSTANLAWTQLYIFTEDARTTEVITALKVL